MGYKGQTYQLPFSRGGLSHNANIELIEPESMIYPSRNIDIGHGGREKRGGTALVHSTSTHLSGSTASDIMGLFDFRTVAGNQYILSCNDSGDVYSTSTNTIATGLTANEWFDFEVMDDSVYFTNTQNVPQSWDGGAGNSSDIDNPAADWGAADYPQQLVKHGRGNSERMWAIGVPSYNYRVYASANGNAKDFSSTSVVTVDIETGDGFGILGGAEFGDKLFCFGKNQTYVIDDSNLDSDFWGYYPAPWRGGAATWRLIEKIPNDIIVMTEEGDIYSVRMAEQYGDYKQASLVAQSWMNEYIKDYVNLSEIDRFHMRYDPVLRALKVFVARGSNAAVDAALVYFIDRDPKEAWIVYGNDTNASGYDASVSALVRVDAGDYQVYTGDYNARLWKLETAGRNDNDADYYAGFKTGELAFGNSRQRKHFKRGWVVAQPRGNWDLEINWWVDGVAQTARTVNLAGSGALLGAFVLGTDKLGAGGLIKETFELGNYGERLQLEMYNETADENFYLSQALIDFKPLGPEAGD